MRGEWWAVWVAVAVATTLAVALLLGWVPTLGVLLAAPLTAVPQWALLRPALPQARRWLALTSAGLAIAPLTYLLGAAPVLLADYVHQFLLRLPGTRPLVPFVVLTAGAGAGDGLGLCQGLALVAGRRRRWAWAFAAASAIGGGAVYAAYVPLLSHLLRSIGEHSPDATPLQPYQLTPAVRARNEAISSRVTFPVGQ